MFLNNKIQKLLSVILIILVISPAFSGLISVKKAEAQFFTVTELGPATMGQFDVLLGTIATGTTTSAVRDVKQWASEILKQFLMLTAKRLLARMTQNTINWINSGFHGNPLYLENPKSFFSDIAKTEVKNLVNMFGYDRIRYPYGRDFAQNIINSYQAQLATNAEYSLSRVINDPVLLESYRTNFNAGGWNAFLINTQYPQNNYIGFNMLATEELARRLEGTSQNAAQKVQTMLNQGQGFLSPMTCPSNPHYNNLKNEFQRPTFQPTVPYNPPAVVYPGGDGDEPTPESARARAEYDARYTRDVANERGVWQMTNDCPEGLVATTPGSVVASHIQKALNAKIDQTTLAGALGNDLTSSVAAILDALMQKFLSDGLNSLSNAINPDELEECDFDYMGDRLENCGGVTSSTGGGGGCSAYISQAVEGFRGEVVAAIDRALSQDPALANLPATRENGQRFRDLVVGQLQSAGFDATASYNGNCNLSPNNLGVRSNSAAVGEIYDVVRDDPSMTIRTASTTVGRPLYNGNAGWDFLVNGRPSSPEPEPALMP